MKTCLPVWDIVCSWIFRVPKAKCYHSAYLYEISSVHEFAAFPKPSVTIQPTCMRYRLFMNLPRSQSQVLPFSLPVWDIVCSWICRVPKAKCYHSAYLYEISSVHEFAAFPKPSVSIQPTCMRYRLFMNLPRSQSQVFPFSLPVWDIVCSWICRVPKAKSCHSAYLYEISSVHEFSPFPKPSVSIQPTCMRYRLFMNLPRSQSQVFPFSLPVWDIVCSWICRVPKAKCCRSAYLYEISSVHEFAAFPKPSVSIQPTCMRYRLFMNLPRSQSQVLPFSLPVWDIVCSWICRVPKAKCFHSAYLYEISSVHEFAAFPKPSVAIQPTCMRYRLFMNLPRSQSQVFPFSLPVWDIVCSWIFPVPKAKCFHSAYLYEISSVHEFAAFPKPSVSIQPTCMRYRLFMNLPRSQSQVFPFSLPVWDIVCSWIFPVPKAKCFHSAYLYEISSVHEFAAFPKPSVSIQPTCMRYRLFMNLPRSQSQVFPFSLPVWDIVCSWICRVPKAKCFHSAYLYEISSVHEFSPFPKPSVSIQPTCMRYRLFMNLPCSQSQVFPFSLPVWDIVCSWICRVPKAKCFHSAYLYEISSVHEFAAFPKPSVSIQPTCMRYRLFMNLPRSQSQVFPFSLPVWDIVCSWICRVPKAKCFHSAYLYEISSVHEFAAFPKPSVSIQPTCMRYRLFMNLPRSQSQVFPFSLPVWDIVCSWIFPVPKAKCFHSAYLYEISSVHEFAAFPKPSVSIQPTCMRYRLFMNLPRSQSQVLPFSLPVWDIVCSWICRVPKAKCCHSAYLYEISSVHEFAAFPKPSVTIQPTCMRYRLFMNLPRSQSQVLPFSLPVWDIVCSWICRVPKAKCYHSAYLYEISSVHEFAAFPKPSVSIQPTCMRYRLFMNLPRSQSQVLPFSLPVWDIVCSWICRVPKAKCYHSASSSSSPWPCKCKNAECKT